MPLFELTHPCFNCRVNQWRLGMRRREQTEFICCSCGATRYFDLDRQQFEYLVGAD